MSLMLSGLKVIDRSVVTDDCRSKKKWRKVVSSVRNY